MAWNEPGNRGESPWGKKRPASKAGGGLNETLKNWQQRMQSAMGMPAGEGGGGGEGGEPTRLGLLFAALAFALWLTTGFFIVDASEKGVIQRFGAYTGVVGEGAGFTFPWPIGKVTKVNVSEVKSYEHLSSMLTADVNLVDVRAVIQYQNADPVKALFRVKDVAKTLEEVSESAVREVVGQANLDGVLGAARQQISASTRELIQRTLDAYNCGIRVTSVNLTSVEVPPDVKAAQLDTNKAKEDRERFGNAAQAYANDILPKAKGESQRLLQDAEAYKSQVVTRAEGDVARFNSIYAAYSQAPEVTRQRMYIEAIEQIMAQSKKVILDTKGGAGGNMLYLPLDKLLERNAPRPPSPAATAPQQGDDLPTVTIEGRARGAR